ncbi:hypothetical protein D9757_007055 [Collybiopsis confluens]|uniref:Alpha/beta-hydrolase n=1 Tax=Collybiopsis confluens TaxID=2823264 RepID=A0A8H5HCX1_9AGAR|nr:hypothetical protein D9757_007055 [Collybiopsis confluens]
MSIETIPIECRTLTYKTLNLPGDIKVPILLDLHFSPSAIRQNLATKNDLNLACLCYFHGGGLVVGDRKSWFPKWLSERITAAGHVFISPDYRLIPSGSTTSHEVLEDVQDVFQFISGLALDISSEEFSISPSNSNTLSFRIDPDRIAASGSSAGANCAYLAAMHANPKPKAVLSMYGQGGNFLIPHYYAVKHSVFLRGREMLDPNLFPEFLYPAPTVTDRSRPITGSPNTYFPPESPADSVPIPGSSDNTGPPGFPSNRRMFLGRLYLQMGRFLDYYTGEHDPSLSVALRRHAEDLRSTPLSDSNDATVSTALANIIPEKHRHLFPSLCSPAEYASWPPVYFFHGSLDSAVPIQESYHLHDLLHEAGVSPVMSIAEGMEHSFDYEPGAEDVHREEFDKIQDWLDQFLRQQ